jgi:hypothetical protein
MMLPYMHQVIFVCTILQISYTVEVWKILELIYYYLYVN